MVAEARGDPGLRCFGVGAGCVILRRRARPFLDQAPPEGLLTARRYAALAAVVLLASCVRIRVARDPEVTPATAVAAAQALLDHGAAAWNRGDLDAFVSDYAEEATFVTSQGVVRGRAAIRARYAPRFQAGAPRDSLWFQGVEARPVAPDGIQAVAWWNLSRGDSVAARGPTSLLLRRVDGRWFIVHDHSS